MIKKSMSQAIFQKITELLDTNHAEYRVLEHPAAGKSDSVSKIRGNALEESAKALVVRAKKSENRKYLLLVLRGSDKADLSRFADLGDIQLATPEKVMELTDCEIGTVPPFSFNAELELIVDPVLLENQNLWFNAGLFDHSICLKAQDYQRIVQPKIQAIRLAN